MLFKTQLQSTLQHEIKQRLRLQEPKKKKTVQSRKQSKKYKSITPDKTEYIMKTLKNNTCVKRGLETLQTTDVRAFFYDIYTSTKLIQLLFP